MEIIHIAIVDDDRLQRDLMQHLIQQVAEKHQLSIKQYHFESAEAFLFAFEDLPTLSLVFLDIQMQVLNGMEAAHKIRKLNNQLALVFVTAYAEYALEGYHVNALDYILKPITLEQVNRTFERLLTQLQSSSQTRYLLVEANGQHFKFPLQTIIYLEAAKHQTELTLIDRQFIVNRNLSHMQADLDERFVQTHRSYIVNLAHVDQLTKQQLLMSNGEKVPISRRLDKKVQTAFVNFYKRDVFYE